MIDRSIAVFLLFFPLAAPAEQATLVIPDQNWVVSFDAPPLIKRDESNKPSRYMYHGSAGKFHVSLFVERPTCTGGETHEDYLNCFFPKVGEIPMVVTDSIRKSCEPKFCKVAYDMSLPRSGWTFVHRHVHYLFAYRGKWVDLHVSIAQANGFTQEDLNVLEDFEKSFTYGERL